METETKRSLSDVGGTSGGLGEFLLGFVMACAGGYLLTQRVVVTSSFWSLWGTSSFGLTLVPMLFGVGLLFFNGRSFVGWLLTIGGGVFILAGVIMNLHVFFQPTSLFNTILMLVLLAGGIGLVAKALRPHRK
jgi:hypothetical protein